MIPRSPARDRQVWVNSFGNKGPRCCDCEHWDGRPKRLLCTLGEFITLSDCGCREHKPKPERG